MAAYTTWLGEDSGAASDPAIVGGKGANLHALTAADFPVPDGFVITTDAYCDVIESAGLTDAAPERLRAAIPALRLPSDLTEQILDAYARLGSPAVAVRSSGTAEDLDDVSFAGQHDTYLDVEGSDAVLRAVLDCWASLWTPRAVAYRQRIGWDESSLALAVVVQRMVHAEWAGVLFTVDPISGRRDRMILEAVVGVGEALVSGEVTGEHVEVDKASGRAAGDERRTAGSSDGSRLPRSVIRELAALGREVERRFGSPQDIEWTYADGHCALVQARPLTALPDESEEAQASARHGRGAGRRGSGSGGPGGRTPRRRESRSTRESAGGTNRLGMFAVTADHMPYPPFPMDVSLIFRPVFGALLGGIRSAGFSAPPVADVLVEIDAGVVQIRPPRVRPTWRAVWRVPAVTPALVRLMRTRTHVWRARSEDTLLPLARLRDSQDLSALNEVQLLAAAQELIHAVGTIMPSRFGALTGGMAAEGILSLLVRGAVGGDRAGYLHAALMSEVPCVLTDENADLERIAALVRRSPDVRAVYLDVDPEHVAERLGESAAGRTILAEVAAHLQTFGYRSLSIFTVGLPPLRDMPQVVHGLIAGLVRRDDAPTAAPGSRYERARSELESLTGFRARMLRPLITRRLTTARAGAGFRDDSQYVLEISLAVTRRILLELGHRLVARGILSDPDDIAYLEADEVALVVSERAELAARDQDPLAGGEQTAAASGSAASVRMLSELIAHRKTARAAALDHYTVVPAELFESGRSDGRVSGMPASRGRVVGRVRVIHDESEFSNLQVGEILVCPFTNPTWTPLFSLAAAVVVDSGGAASHAAIVAREVGIPAVMGTGNGTHVLTDGQRVIVDADRGLVVPVDAPTRHAFSPAEGARLSS
ncbi:PEP/pyruvate-binding domain-containing protein [Rathayibacter sp. CAU 1779]